MISNSLKINIENSLGLFYSKEVEINTIKAVEGGCINNSHLLQSNLGSFFLKWNNSSFPKMYEKEAFSLSFLGKNSPLTIPKPLIYEEGDRFSFLVLENIQSEKKKESFWRNFGRDLAQQHRVSENFFGFNHSNYIGSLTQNNNQKKEWAEFFILERLEPLLEMAMNNSFLSKKEYGSFQSLFYKLDSLFPKEKPALLHGDLWSGNFMVGKKGEAVIFDPAISFGHREMDIGMTKLFGGFSEEFYLAYFDEFPLENAWEERVDLCNIYPLLVHLNIFGAAYYSQLMHNVKSFI
jgi:protein-ribulosamine 3-kinase